MNAIEKETIILFNEGETVASIFTCNVALQNKLIKLSEERPEDVIKDIRKSMQGGAEFIVPKSWIKVNPSRNLTAEQRQAKSEAAKKRFKRSF